jgi:hypothetical protein
VRRSHQAGLDRLPDAFLHLRFDPGKDRPEDCAFRTTPKPEDDIDLYSRGGGLPAHDLLRSLQRGDDVRHFPCCSQPTPVVQSIGGTSLDAATLPMPMVKFVGPVDPRFLSTLGEMEENLVDDSLVYR